MRDPVGQLVISLRNRGVSLQLIDGKLRCKGPITADERKRITENAKIVAAILAPDDTLPDVVHVPPDVPNNVISIEAFINRQRVARKLEEEKDHLRESVR